VRYMSLDTKHPIAQIAAEPITSWPMTRLQRILQLLLSPLPERAIIGIPLPPLRMLSTDNRDYSPAPLQISVYSDGSQTSQGAGYGYAVYFGPILVTKGHGPAGPRTEVYDAEIMGAVEGLRAALRQTCVGYSTQLVILLDNLAAASLLASYRPTPHRHGLSESFGQLATQWLEAPSSLTMPRKPLQVRWIPGHSGISGNELADKLAKLGSSIHSPSIPPSPAYL
jgi:ribonuclease HI